MADVVKQAVAGAVFAAIQRAIDEGRLVSWPVDKVLAETGNLERAIWVRPVEGQPRRQFVVTVKEYM